MKRCSILLYLVGFALLLVACKDDPVTRMPDFTPVGDGMKTLAYAIVGGSVVLTLGRLLRP